MFKYGIKYGSKRHRSGGARKHPPQPTGTAPGAAFTLGAPCASSCFIWGVAIFSEFDVVPIWRLGGLCARISRRPRLRGWWRLLLS